MTLDLVSVAIGFASTFVFSAAVLAWVSRA
jgi:hypothetical protein